mgnify:CR=1 FL=1
MENSEISWCDHTHNHWEGCTKVSPGCAHCYAEARDKRFTGGIHWGAGAPRRLTSLANRNKPHRWNRAAAEALKNHSEECAKDISYGQHVKPPARPRVFCSSLADWLDDEVPLEWLADLLGLIHETPHLDWLLLTKRPQMWELRCAEVAQSAFPDRLPRIGANLANNWFGGEEAPANVWIGTTVEDQQRADERIPALLNIPARVRFLSCEPLLGPVNLTVAIPGGSPSYNSLKPYRPDYRKEPFQPSIHWVICGGESGPGARPMHSDWARSLRDQCAAAGVAFHFKQWGEWAEGGNLTSNGQMIPDCLGSKKDDPAHYHYFETAPYSKTWRVGKKLAGRLLDDVRHDAFPTL